MAAAYVQLAQASGNGAASQSKAFSSNVTAGNLIAYFFLIDGGGGSLSGAPTTVISDTLGNTYTKVTSILDTTNGLYTEIGYAKNISGGANTIKGQVTAPGGWTNFVGIAGAELSGLDTSTPFTSGEFSGNNQNAGLPSGSNNLTSGNTPALGASNRFLVGWTTVKHALLGTSWLTAGTGFTGQAQFWDFGNAGNVFAGIETEQLASSAAVAAKWTTTDLGNNYDTYAIAFSPASSNVSVNLAGQSIASTEGTISPQVAYGLAGQSITSSLGIITATVSYGVQGRQIASTLGVVSPQVAYGLIGLAIASSEGIITRVPTSSGGPPEIGPGLSMMRLGGKVP